MSNHLLSIITKSAQAIQEFEESMFLPNLENLNRELSSVKIVTDDDVTSVINEVLLPLLEMDFNSANQPKIIKEIDTILLGLSTNPDLSLKSGRTILSVLASTQRSIPSTLTCVYSILLKFQKTLEYRDLDFAATAIFSALYNTNETLLSNDDAIDAFAILAWILRHPENPITVLATSISALDVLEYRSPHLPLLLETIINQINAISKNLEAENNFLQLAMRATIRKQTLLSDDDFLTLIHKIVQSPHLSQADATEILHVINDKEIINQKTAFLLAGIFRNLCTLIKMPAQLKIAQSEYRRILIFIK